MSALPHPREPDTFIERRTATIARARAFDTHVLLYVVGDDGRELEVRVDPLESAALAINVIKSAKLAMGEELKWLIGAIPNAAAPEGVRRRRATPT